MFGGVCHLLNGNMFGGVYKDKLILRLGVDETEKALKQKYIVPFDITGKPMKGWVMVEKKGFLTEEKLNTRLNRGRKFERPCHPNELSSSGSTNNFSPSITTPR